MPGSIAYQNSPLEESIKFQNPEIVLAAINSIDKAIQITLDVDVVLDQLMDIVLEVFNSSRTWLFHPCNPNLPSFNVAFESTTPEYPGANALNKQVPMTEDMAGYCRRALSAKEVPENDPPEGQPITNDIADLFNVKSMLFMALHPKSGEPWMFGLHQCDRSRVWSSDEKKLFHMIGQRITSCIDNFLYIRQLKEREELLNYSQQLSKIGSFVWDLSTDDLQWSKNMYHIYGIDENSFEENLTEIYHKLIHPDDQGRIQMEIEKMIKAAHVWSMEFRIIRSDGKERIMRSSGKFALDKNGKPVKCIGVHQDITDQKISENALEESETRYRTFINSTSDFVYLKDENFKHIVANTALCEFFGKEQEKVIGLSDFELMPEEAAKVCRETDKKALETGSVFITEEPVGDRIFESIKFPVNLGNSKTGVGSYIRDITERKNASDSLENERSFLNAVLDNIEEAIVICNEEGQLIRFNKSARRLHGIPEKPITPDEWSIFYDLYRVDGKTSLAVHEIPLFNALQGEKVGGEEIIVAPKNSKPRLMVCNGQALYDSGGKKIGAVIAMHDLTDQKRAEDDLRHSEEKYRQLVQYAPAALYEIDFINNRFITVNDVACKYTGYKKRELLEMIPTDILTRKSAQHFGERLQKIFSGEKVSPAVEYQIKKKDGGTLWAEFNVQMTYEGKNIKGATVVAHDITDRKRAEEALRKSEKKYRLIAENMADIITTMDMDLNFTYVSPSVIKLRGFSVEEALEQRIDQIMTPESFLRLSDAFAEELSLEQTGMADPDRARIIELEEYKKDGTTIWVENTASFIRDKDQKPSGILVASCDITDRKQAEKALRDSESRFRRLADMLPEAVFETDKDLNLTYANQQAFNIFGYSQQDLDDGLNCFDMLAPEERNRAFENIARRFKGEEFGASEHLGIRKDGSTFPVLLHTNPIYRKRAVDGIRGIIVDLSESKKMEAQVRQANKMESLGTLAGGIAHEFNNMLGIIIGNTELAIDDIPEWNPAANCIQEIKTASLRAKDVVRKLLSVARKTPESRKPLQIGSVIKESLDLMRRTIPATIDIRKNITCSTEMILGDITEINQIVINLCTNSVHAMAEESGVLEVSLDTKQLDRESAFHYEDLKSGNYVKLTVQDTGEGIDPAFMDRLFDPYFTTKDVDQGVGMGLAVVHGIVKNHDGAIKIQSELGKGTIVEVLFPLIEAQAEARTEEIETPQMGTERILLVDDEPSIVTMVTQMLKRSGYEVVGETCSSSALKTFKEDPKQFDVVISDMAMPEMSGDQLAQAIKQIRPEVPIILCTGHSDRMDENKAKKLGIEAFITKPFSRKKITEIIPKVLYRTKPENQD